jgi:hypothetical protein
MKRRHQLASIVAMGMAVGISTTFAAPATGLAARLTVKGDLKKEQKSDKNESERSSTRSTTETLAYELDIQVSNTSKQEGTFDLEWYFIKRPLDSAGQKGDPVLCEKDKTSLTIGGQKRVAHKVVSQELVNSESKTSKESSGNSDSSKSSGSSKRFSGDTFAGYIVLVRHQGEILAKYSNEAKFTTDEWIAKLDGPVQRGSGSKAPASTEKKKKKKK